MPTTTATYVSTFPPPVSKQIKLSASSLSPPSSYTRPPDTFHHFQLLPCELQHQIWTEAAKEWIKEYLERVNTWMVGGNKTSQEDDNGANTLSSSNCNNDYENDGEMDGCTRIMRIASRLDDSSSKRVFLIHITSDSRYRRQSPNLLWACAASRAVLRSTLLNVGSKTPVPRGEGIQLFLRRCVTALMGLGKPSIFGCRILDFRLPGLLSRMREEERRIEQMGKELGQVIAGEVVDAESAEAAENRAASAAGRYVRLPLLNGLGRVFRKDFESGEWSVRELYPVVDMDTR